MPRKEHPSLATAGALPARTRSPQWRAILEARWQAHLEEVTELSLAYHGAAAAAPAGNSDGAGQQKARRLLHRAVAARRKLADTEEALSRLAAGNFGSCEQCGSAITAGLLAIAPEVRYCPRCADGPALARRLAAAGRTPQ